MASNPSKDVFFVFFQGHVKLSGKPHEASQFWADTTNIETLDASSDRAPNWESQFTPWALGQHLPGLPEASPAHRFPHAASLVDAGQLSAQRLA